MARGLPVVATRVGGLPEVVAEGVTGLLVRPGDPAALARAILEIWDDPRRGDRMGHAGRQRTEETFDVRRMVAEYETLYRQCAPGRASSARTVLAVR
jgi:glycosyltransferase involved in cell wall biosynthesis